jgi:hypothetical protein
MSGSVGQFENLIHQLATILSGSKYPNLRVGLRTGLE